MDTTAVIHSSTPETIAQLTVRITDLERALATELQKNADLERSLASSKQYNSSHYDNYKNLLAQVDSFMETLGNYARDNDIDYEIATDLADCFGRELTRKVYGHIRIEGDVELEVPVNFDLDDIGDELDIHIGQSYTSTVRVDYSDISLVEIEEN